LGKNTLLKCEKTNIAKTVEDWALSEALPHLRSYDGDQIVIDRCAAIHDTGIQEVFEIKFDNGDVEFVTMNHKFLCSDNEYHEVREIIDKGLDVVSIESCKSDRTT
jgi:hypothetical protein